MRILRPEDVGALIRSRRLGLGLDQQTLADKLGVNRRWIWSVERGKGTVQLDLTLRVLNELGIHLTANLEPERSSATSPRSTKPPRDSIDNIADMGLDDDPLAKKAPARKRKSRNER